MQWTEEQKQVIAHRRGNALVSAAAGSGKTAVLVERVLQMLLDPEAPVLLDRLLIVTFTNAAAAQMKEKIRDRLQQAAEQAPDNPFIQEQMDRMAQASITTIHAFCLQIIRDYITRIPELDPGFRVGEQTEMELLRSDVLSRVLEDCYLRSEVDPEAERDFLAFVEACGGTRQDTGLEELLLKVYGFAESMPDPEAWLHRAVENYSPGSCEDITGTPWYPIIQEELIRTAEDALGSYEQAEGLLENASDPEKAEKTRRILRNLEDQVTALLEGAETDTVEAFSLGLSQISFPRMAYPSQEPQEKERIRNYTDGAKDMLREKAGLWGRLWSPEARQRLEEQVYPVLRGLEMVLRQFHGAYQKAKAEQNILEFSDFEHFALRILREGPEGETTAAARAIREQFDWICIDEYQDSNPIQERILTAIARTDARGEPQNIFMVGDVKQSIYRFRHAEPGLFMEKYDAYGKKEGTSRYLLTRNFRSRPEILRAVNAIFSALMSRENGELDYSEEQQLNPGREFPPRPSEEPPVVLNLLKAGRDRSAEVCFRAEADWIARDIERLLKSRLPIWDEEAQGYRPVQESDIVILLRSVAGRSDTLKRRLEQSLIPCYAESDVNFFDTPEIRLILQLLQILDNPRQDIPLAGVLYSPIFGFTGEELARLRLLNREEEFYKAVEAGRQCEDPKLRKKVQAFFDRLQNWRRLAADSTIHDLLWQIYQESGYYLYASAMPGGEQRRANLDLLLEKSIEFEKGIYSGLFQFLRYVDKLERSQKQTDEAKTVGEGEKAVRIMSIHKSKGLEFPVVYLAGLGSGFNRKDLDAPLLLHRTLGLGAYAMEPGEYLRYTTLPREALRIKLRQEMTAEEMRILYVALTRAREYLILTGTVAREEDEESPVESLRLTGEGRLPAFAVRNAGSWLEWLEPIIRERQDCGAEYREFAVTPPEEDEEEPLSPGAAEAGGESAGMDPDQAFGWQYSYQAETRMGVRFSVSEVKKYGEESREEEEQTIPLIRGEKEGALRGTAMHAFLANADFGRMQNSEDLQRQIAEMQKRGLLAPEDSERLDRTALLRFGASALCSRMQQACALKREQPFIMSFTLGEMEELCPGWLTESAAGRDTRLMIQGIIDCFFEEQGEIVLVDYKTDRNLGEKERRQYGRQLRLYQAALERTTGKRVKEKLLYWTRTGEEIHCG